MVDHVHFEHKNLRAGWANVHAYVNGQLVSGQLRLVRKPEPLPSQPDVSAITDVFNDAIDEVCVRLGSFWFDMFLVQCTVKSARHARSLVACRLAVRPLRWRWSKR